MSACTAQGFFTLTALPPGEKWASIGKADILLNLKQKDYKPKRNNNPWVIFMSKKEIDDGKLCAVLSYFVIGIIWFLVDEKMKKNSYVSFHVKQAIVLLIFSILIGVLNPIMMFHLSIVTIYMKL